MQEKAAIIIYVILAICGASVGTASSHAEWSSLGYSHSSHFSSSSDSGPSCLDICGNSSTQLVWSVPYVINYALPDGSEWFEEEICNCSWLIAAPDDSVIEVSVIRNRPPNGPQISVYSDDEGAKSSLMYELQHGELGIYYSNVSTIHIAATHPTDFSFQFKPVVCDIKLTAYEKQECSPDQFKCYNQQCLVGDRQCDGKTDCQVHEDEYGCGINCSSVDQYVCPASSTCIGSHLVCDGHGDCPGIFDELNCGRCGDPHIDLGFNPTVSITQPVDFAVGCLWLVTASSHSHSRFRVDIINLPVVVHGSTTTQPASLSLGHGRDPANGHKLVRTMNSTTYPAVVTLDSPVMWIILDTHCDASELPAKWLDCLEFTLSEYDIKECPSNQYACSAGLLCIDRTRLCDGVADCPEFDDEFGCGSCSTNMFTCRNLGGCVDASMLCDGQHDCTDGSDEGKCEPCGTDVIHLSSGPYILSSIGYPANYPHIIHCLWHVYAENDYDVLVVFHDFKTEKKIDILSISNGFDSVEISGEMYPERMSFFSEDIWIDFRSDYSYSFRGFNLTLQEVKSASCTDAEVNCSSTALLYCISEHRVCDCAIDCPDETDESNCTEPCGTDVIHLSSGPYILSSIGYPANYPHNAHCLWHVYAENDYDVLVVFHDFKTENKFDILSISNGFDSVEISGEMYPERMSFFSEDIWIDFRSDYSYSFRGFNLTLQEVKSASCTDGEVNCSSTALLYCISEHRVCDCAIDCPDETDESNCTEPCGTDVIRLSSGPYILSSIGYPANYPHNAHCLWHVYAENDYDVLVVFHDFKTENKFDILSISNGFDSVEISGEMYPERMSFFSEDIWIDFRSDYSYSFRGFNLTLQEVKSASCTDREVNCSSTALLYCISEQRVCNGAIDCPDETDESNCTGICSDTLIDAGNSSHAILSPLFNEGLYPDLTECVWRVTTKPPANIQLNIHSFSLEEHFDFLFIGIGHDIQGEKVAILTGTTKISTILIQTNHIWLHLSTDYIIGDTGFNITVKAADKHAEDECSSCHLHSCATACLQSPAYCDGVVDCTEKEDEQNCVNVTCGANQFLCPRTKQCVPHEMLCDGKADCIQFGDDEDNCDIHGRPDGCESFMVKEILGVKCKQGWNTTTIHQLVKRTYSLELSGANVGTLGEGLFRRLILLRSLSLRNNNISQIKLGAFSGLENLTALDLSENNIEEMHGGIFSELKTLLALAIRSVPVQYVRANAFAGLTHLQKLVLMRGNGTVSALSSSQYDWPIEFEDQALEDLTSLHTVYVDDHRLCCDFRSVLPSDDQCISIRFQSPLFNCGRLMPKTVLQVFMWILGCSALLGNMLVIVWRMREDSGKGSKYVHSFLVLNLAMSDFLMGVYMVIIATVDAIEKEKYYLTATQWRNSALCKAAGVISVLSSEASVFFITLISVDRYLCIVHPFSRVRLQETSVWVSVASIWFASLVVSLVPTILATSDSDIYGLSDVCIGLPLLTRPVDYTFTKDDVGGSLGNDTYLIPQPVGSRPTWSYSIVLFLGVNFMCFLVITVSYIAIFAKVKRSVRRVKLRSHKAEEIKMASKMAVIVGSDCLCWMPVIVLGILSQTSVIQIKPEAYAWLVVFVLPINSSLNPYLYTIVTAISQRRQAHQSTKKRSKGPEKTCSPDLPMEMRGDSGCWTITTPNATPTNSIYHGHPD